VVAALVGHAYISLETFKKDGSGVKTPVWFADVGGALYVVTAGESFKVKRLRRNNKARVAACNASGGTILGPWLDAEVDQLTPGDEWVAAHAALRAKYGWQMWLLDAGAKLSGRYKQRAMLKVRVLAP